MKKLDIAVIGAGPAGLTTSLFIRKHEVVVFEEHSSPGIPKHCTGLVGRETYLFYKELLGEEIISNKYYGIIYHSPINTFFLYNKEPIAYRIERPLLEQKLVDQVTKLGHHIVFGEKAYPTNNPTCIKTRQDEYEASTLVVSDGASSIFKRKYYHVKPKVIFGYQGVFRTTCVEDNYFHVVYDSRMTEFFGWLVPIDKDKVLIGYMTSATGVDPRKIFHYISKRVRVKTGSLLETFGGLIPQDLPFRKPVYGDKIYFIGDALPATKPYTGGGLYGIVKLSPILGRSIEKKEPGTYLEAVMSLRKRFLLERIAVEYFRRIGYWKPTYIVSWLNRLGMFKADEYDKHYRLILKSIPVLPAIYTWLEFKTIFSRISRRRS